ncbi:hypothetical protein [Dyadobacter sp. CY323]|uniref:hypothetical protein n=1 Tax=Dyadobacter sp. CY323 TaxID=2907302 RepID=UPI001F1E9B85|nr:hypothetical protein [Dyadobacter sp. CY323]MCE6987489.1 hypothetical protein [Dyadobacter sp. CY323]
MSKKTKSVTAWLSEKFGISHKAISESLSAEQYSQFVGEAEKVAADDLTGEGAEDSEAEKQLENKDADATAIKALEGKVTNLEAQLTAANTALEGEKKAHESTSAKLVETEGKLTASEAQKEKLRQAVNPLSDEDLVNKGSENNGLTQADIQAREAYKKNNPKA